MTSYQFIGGPAGGTSRVVEGTPDVVPVFEGDGTVHHYFRRAMMRGGEPVVVVYVYHGEVEE